MTTMTTKPPAEPGPGHNLPPAPSPLTLPQIDAYLDAAHANLKARRDQLLVKLTQIVAQVPTIDDDEVWGAVSDNMTLVDALNAAAERGRKEAKEPFWEGGKLVDRWFKAIGDSLAIPMQTLQARCNDYVRRKDEIRQKEAAAEAARLLAIANEEAARARAAMRTAEPDAGEALNRAADAAQDAVKAADLAAGKTADRVRTYTDSGVTVSAKTTWSWELVDIAKVPLSYLTVNEAAVKEAARERDQTTGRPLVVIPGIKWVGTTTSTRR